MFQNELDQKIISNLNNFPNELINFQVIARIKPNLKKEDFECIKIFENQEV